MSADLSLFVHKAKPIELFGSKVEKTVKPGGALPLIQPSISSDFLSGLDLANESDVQFLVEGRPLYASKVNVLTNLVYAEPL